MRHVRATLSSAQMATRMTPQQLHQRQQYEALAQQSQAARQAGAAEQQKQQLAVGRDLQGTTLRISQAMAELQGSHDQKAAQLQAAMVQLDQLNNRTQLQKRELLEQQVQLFMRFRDYFLGLREFSVQADCGRAFACKL